MLTTVANEIYLTFFYLTNNKLLFLESSLKKVKKAANLANAIREHRMLANTNLAWTDTLSRPVSDLQT